MSLENLIFTSVTGIPQLNINVQYKIDKITNLMNKQKELQAKKEKRDCIPIKHIHPHALSYPNLLKIQTFLNKYLILLDWEKKVWILLCIFIL